MSEENPDRDGKDLDKAVKVWMVVWVGLIFGVLVVMASKLDKIIELMEAIQ